MKMHWTLVRPVLWFWFLLGALWSSTQVASCDFMEYSSGHADIRTEFTGGRIELKWGLDVGLVAMSAIGFVLRSRRKPNRSAGHCPSFS